MRRARRRRQVHLVFRGRKNSVSVQRYWLSWPMQPGAKTTNYGRDVKRILLRAFREASSARKRHRAEAENRRAWRQTHGHCPCECEHPQPIWRGGIRLCGVCWYGDGARCQMIPCTPVTCPDLAQRTERRPPPPADLIAGEDTVQIAAGRLLAQRPIR